MVKHRATVHELSSRGQRIILERANDTDSDATTAGRNLSNDGSVQYKNNYSNSHVDPTSHFESIRLCQLFSMAL